MSVNKYSTTAASNTSIGDGAGAVGIQEGMPRGNVNDAIRAMAADAATAELLNVAPGFPLLSVERLSFTYGDKPVELRRGLYDTTQHFYRNELN